MGQSGTKRGKIKHFVRYIKLSQRRTPLGPAPIIVHLREISVLQRVKLREERKAGTNSRCPFYRGVHFTEVSVKTVDCTL